MAQVRDEVSEQLLGLRHGPEIFSAHAEGFLFVAVEPRRFLGLQTLFSEVLFLGSGTDYLLVKQMPSLLHTSKLISCVHGLQSAVSTIPAKLNLCSILRQVSTAVTQHGVDLSAKPSMFICAGQTWPFDFLCLYVK